MLNGTLHTDHAPPMPDGDGNAVQLALLDQAVRQTRADVAMLRRDVGELTRLAQQARGRMAEVRLSRIARNQTYLLNATKAAGAL